MKSVSIDRSKPLAEDPGTGHNRWHPDTPPIIEADPGEEVWLETREASDIPSGWEGPSPPAPSGRVHPLTGPVYVKGAEPGDLLEIEYLDIEPQPVGRTTCGPGMGFLPDLLTERFNVHWRIADGWATSEQVPGVRIPDSCFMGTAGVAPSHALLAEWTKRESELAARGGRAMLPSALDAVPAVEPIASQGARTAPPRENCGNIDAKQLTRGSRLLVPVFVPGALFSVGDAHFAQGDGEVCLTAIEMGATVAVRFQLHKGEAARRAIRWPRLAHAGYFQAPEWAVPRNFIATTGMPVRPDGTQEGGDLNLAARNALLHMIELLQERGFTKAQAYVICSVAVDLRISNVVDLPNVTVTAVLPEAIFQG
ncbi:MAG TPA: acetamidase/formamidase family protein [Dehalococcoidia bacterium]|nr:acetamidase/formamidase family protein [Dehalococcoidia bacterium]